MSLFLCSFKAISLFKNIPKRGAEVLSHVPEHKKVETPCVC